MASPKSTEKPKSSSGWSSFVGVLVALVVAIAIASGGSMTRVEAGVFTVAHAIFTAKAKLSADPRGMPPQCVAGESLMRVARPPKKVGSHSEEVALTRKAMGSLAALFPPMKCKVSEASVNGVKVFWVVPDKVSNTTGSKTLVYFHGGAYIGGSFASHAPFVCDIATAVGIRAFFVEYTLAPEKEHPGGVLEAVTAYKWLTSEGGVPSTNTVIAGDSAGGGMTLLTIQSLIQSEHALPAAAAVLSPWADLTGKANSFTTKVDEDLLLTPERTINWAKIVLGDRFAEADSPQYSPAFGSFAGFPPLFVSVGTSEILYDDAINVAKKALSQGVKVELSEAEYMQHVFPMFRHYCSIAETEFQKVVRFVKTSLNA